LDFRAARSRSTAANNVSGARLKITIDSTNRITEPAAVIQGLELTTPPIPRKLAMNKPKGMVTSLHTASSLVSVLPDDRRIQGSLRIA
jgi:hypothetical protein